MAAIHNPSQQQQYCLKWNSFHSNMSDVFQTMLIHENLVDVTLACEGASIKAHKMILAACSPYFQNLFMANPCKHPIVILKDVKFCDLKAIIDFIYSGEVNIPQEQLNTLLKTAETLKIKGLSDFGEKQLSNNSVSLKNNVSLPLNYSSSFNYGKKRKRPRIQYSINNTSAIINNNNTNTTSNNNTGGSSSSSNAHKTYSKNASSNNVTVQSKAQPEVTNGENGESSDEEEEEGNNSSKSASIDKSFFSSGVNSPSYKSSQQPFENNDNDRDDSEEFEPTKLLEQSMSTPENTGVDYSPENNDGQVQSGDEEEAEENSKSFMMDDEYSSNNSNTDLSVLPVGMNSFANQFVNSTNSNSSMNGGGSNVSRTIEGIREYEQLLAEIQQKNLTTCPICSKEFIKKSKLIRHYHTHFSDFRPKFSCVFCGKLFTTQDWCKRHALNCQLKQYQHISHLDLYND